MSKTIIYRINKDGYVIKFSEIDDINRMYVIIWSIIYELYNDLFINEIERPEWMSDDYPMNFSDLQITGDMKPFWDMIHNEEVLFDHRIVFASTFDRVIIMKEDFSKVILAYENFIKHMTSKLLKKFFEEYDFSGLREFSDTLKKLKEDENCIGVTMCSSLISSFWENYSEDGKFTPYNIFKQKNHSNLFDNLNKKNK